MRNLRSALSIPRNKSLGTREFEEISGAGKVWRKSPGSAIGNLVRQEE
jgi:hypothetical protein